MACRVARGSAGGGQGMQALAEWVHSWQQRAMQAAHNGGGTQAVVVCRAVDGVRRWLQRVRR